MRPAEFDPAEYLKSYGAEHTPTLAVIPEDVETLEQERRSARGAERRPALRRLALAHMFLADEATERRDIRRHRRAAQRYARQVRRGNRDAYLGSEMAFLDLWIAWQSGSRNAARTADRFTDRHLQSGELLIMAWLIRGEIAFAKERWRPAERAYRYVVALIDHPLYAFALYRTAYVHKGAGRVEEARQALEEVSQLGCAREVDRAVAVMAERAAAELHTGMRTDPDGSRRPSSCPAEASQSPVDHLE